MLLFQGKKEEDSKMAKFMVTMAYGKGVIGCHQYSGHIDSEKFTVKIVYGK